MPVNIEFDGHLNLFESVSAVGEGFEPSRGS